MTSFSGMTCSQWEIDRTQGTKGTCTDVANKIVLACSFRCWRHSRHWAPGQCWEMGILNTAFAHFSVCVPSLRLQGYFSIRKSGILCIPDWGSETGISLNHRLPAEGEVSSTGGSRFVSTGPPWRRESWTWMILYRVFWKVGFTCHSLVEIRKYSKVGRMCITES